MTQDMQPLVGICTDVGQVRRQNEDSVVEPPRQLPPAMLQARGWLYGVADGMGGEAGGKRASELAAATIPDHYYRDADGDITRSLRRAILEANHVIHQETQRNPALSRMGTTITAVVVHGDALVVGHVGDSRAYLIRSGQTRMLTLEHTRVAELVRSGALTPDQASRHPDRHVLTRALGADPRVEVDITTEKFQPGDSVVICSDGLSNVVEPGEIQTAVERLTPPEAAQSLVALANRRGGPDNISVVVIQAPGGPTPPPPPKRSLSLPLLLGILAAFVVLGLGASFLLRQNAGTSTLAANATPSGATPPAVQAESVLAATQDTATPPPSPTSAVLVSASTPTADLSQPKISATTANVRAGPSSTQALVGTLPKDTPVQIEGRTDDNSWLYVRTVAGQAGWVARPAILWDGKIEALPVKQAEVAMAPPTETPKAPSTPTASEPSSTATTASEPPSTATKAAPGAPGVPSQTPKPTATKSPTATLAPTSPPAPPTPTPAPPQKRITLGQPPNGTEINGMVTFTWAPSAPLDSNETNETFDVQVCKGAGCLPNAGVTNVQQISYSWCPGDQGTGVYRWRVQVIDANTHEPKGPPSDTWQFTWTGGCGDSGPKDKPGTGSNCSGPGCK